MRDQDGDNQGSVERAVSAEGAVASAANTEGLAFSVIESPGVPSTYTGCLTPCAQLPSTPSLRSPSAFTNLSHTRAYLPLDNNAMSPNQADPAGPPSYQFLDVQQKKQTSEDGILAGCHDSDDEALRCPFCASQGGINESKKLAGLNRHIALNHLQPSHRTLRCAFPLCASFFWTTEARKAHVGNQHRNAEEKSCSECGRPFNRSHKAEEHTC